MDILQLCFEEKFLVDIAQSMEVITNDGKVVKKLVEEKEANKLKSGLFNIGIQVDNQMIVTYAMWW